MANSVQFVTNDSCEKTAVVLPIAEYERLMEDLGDYAVIADRRKEPTISHEQFVSELKQDGTLPSWVAQDLQRRIFGEYHRKRLQKLFELLKDWLLIPSLTVVE